MCFKTGVTTRPASRMVFHGWEEKIWAPCHQPWLYPSNNGKESFQAYRMEADIGSSSALRAFSHRNFQKVWRGKLCSCIASATHRPLAMPLSPSICQKHSLGETDTTGGARQTLGALLVLTTDVQDLDIKE